jgi:hypothetical protein
VEDTLRQFPPCGTPLNGATRACHFFMLNRTPQAPKSRAPPLGLGFGARREGPPNRPAQGVRACVGEAAPCGPPWPFSTSAGCMGSRQALVASTDAGDVWSHEVWAVGTPAEGHLSGACSTAPVGWAREYLACEREGRDSPRISKRMQKLPRLALW